jgi:hypothetical protein
MTNKPTDSGPRYEEAFRKPGITVNSGRIRTNVPCACGCGLTFDDDGTQPGRRYAKESCRVAAKAVKEKQRHEKAKRKAAK